MFNLISRFHLLLLTVLLSTTIVAFLRVPADFAYPAHWGAHSEPDWLWPRDLALLGAPILALVLTIKFALLGALLTKSRLLQSRHIYQPALTLLLTVVGSVQLGLLLVGVGSDLDFIRLTAFGLAGVLLIVGVIVAEAERNSYAGLRMPWPVPGDRAWRFVHLVTGASFGLTGFALALLSWFDGTIANLLGAMAAALLVPVAIAGLATAITLVARVRPERT